MARLGGALPRARRAVAGRRGAQLNNEYRFVNEAFAAIFGYARARDMLDGRVRAHLIAPEDREHVNAVSRLVISGEAPMTRLEFTGVRRDGSRITLETFASPIHDAEGPSAIGLLLDVTVQRRAEAERAAALLREAGPARRRRGSSALAARAARAARGIPARARARGAPAAQQRLGRVAERAVGLPAEDGAAERVTRAQAVIRQIVDSLDNTLAATALQPARGLDPRDADVGALIELSLGDLDAARRSRVRIERVSSTRTASMDIGLMRLALRNVLGNALAYSPAGSEVVLRVVDSDEPLALVFEIADRGPGIPAELMPRLFERGARGSHGDAGPRHRPARGAARDGAARRQRRRAAEHRRARCSGSGYPKGSGWLTRS